MDTLIEWAVYCATALVFALLTTGCAGMEVGAKAGIYEVQHYQHSDQSSADSKPLKCYFTNCESVRGS